MTYPFTAKDWASLTPAQRAQQCRILAAESRAPANLAHPNLKPVYLDLARQWSTLADEIERDIPKQATP